jgi:hypothetical protein
MHRSEVMGGLVTPAIRRISTLARQDRLSRFLSAWGLREWQRASCFALEFSRL